MFFVACKAFLALLPILIGSVLLLAGVAKLIAGPQSFIQTVREYRLLPFRLVSITAWTIIMAEIGVGAFLFAGRVEPVFSALAALLFGAFAFGVAINLVRGRTSISCGCFGAPESRISWWLALRNVAAASCALLIARISPARLSALDQMGACLIVVGLICTYTVLRSMFTLQRFPTTSNIL
jgi:uncharacterized membrane protein YphA (DoxX/SURF4 family)